MELIDIRSDTVTVPTQAMRKAMSEAIVGDDVYGQDPTVNRLQDAVAAMFGKEAALFTPSGLMSNQLSIMAWTQPGNEIIIWQNAHIIDHETSALTILSGVQARQISSKSGILTTEQIEPLIRKDLGVLYPKTALICLQNSLSNGRVWPLQSLKAIKELSNRYGLKIHIDGARIFNAAASSNCHVREIAKYADSVSFCLSKGLCCPIGSLIVGPKDMIHKARDLRKSIGGGLRQSGILAAAGLIALEQILPELPEDHRIAKWIGHQLSKIPQICVEHQNLEANMVFFRIDSNHAIKPPQFVQHLLRRGIKMNQPYEPFFNYRIAVHFYVRQNQAQRIVQAIKQLF